MKVKVSNLKQVVPIVKSYLDFEWQCAKCGHVVFDHVVESTLLQYKKHNIGRMKVERFCSKCWTKHSMELSL